VRRLAEEKSYLQLTLRLIEQLNPLPGIEDMVATMLCNIVETIGGTNIKLWYWIDDQLHYADFLGGNKIVASIDDPMAAEVAQKRRFIERQGDVEDSLLRGGVIPGSWTWAFPLPVGQELLGVIKLENVHIIGASLRNYLPLFFSHAALILSNEIRNFSRLAAETKLRQRERDLRAIMDNLPSIISYWDRNLRNRFGNRAYVAWYGIEPETMVGMYLREVIGEESFQLNLPYIEAALRGETQVFERAISPSGGKPARHALINYIPDIRDGVVDGIYVLVSDITPVKQAEAELDKYRLHLEELVTERTVQLEQAKLTAEAANRMKSVFLANMSHELRTPLNAILGFAQIMERDARIPADEHRNLETINRSGKHLLSIINDVLEISRIEAGRTVVHSEAFDLQATLAAIEEMMRLRADSKHLALRVVRHADLPRTVLGDAHHLRQVLINLLGNAVKYTDTGEVSLAVRPVEGGIRFEVADTGPGIAAADQETIFQAFYQTEHGVAKGEGTGLGLTISREFVHLMGGELSVASIPGKGSVFGFTVPLPPTFFAIAESSHGRVVGLADGQLPPRILVAEDHPDSSELIVCLLDGIGCEVRVAENGRRAVEIFTAWHPDFIWMDMRMPVMDGYAATKAIRALPGGDKVKIVALTASAFREDRAAILAAGCDELISKPVEEDRLFAVMGELLKLGFRHEKEAALPMPVTDATLGLSALPESLRAALLAAADSYDAPSLRGLIERMKPDHPQEAAAIDELVYGYRFDEVAGLCRRQAA